MSNKWLFSVGKDVKQIRQILNKTRKQAVKAFCQVKNEELHKNAAKKEATSQQRGKLVRGHNFPHPV